MVEVTPEQVEEFKRRRAAGPKFKDDTFERKELTEDQLSSFLKSTDSKCDGYST